MIPSPIPASETTYLPVPHIPQQNIVQSPQARLVPCPTAPKTPLNCNLDLSLWRFPRSNPTNLNKATNNVNVFNNIQPNLPPSTANPTIIHPILQMNAQQNPNSNHAANCSIPVNPFSTTTNIAPPFVTPVIHPTYGQTAPLPLVHLFHLVGFKLTKFVSNVPNLADQIDGSPQSTEPKVNASSKEESSHVLGLKWDHNNDTLVVSWSTSSTVTKSLTQRLVLSLVSKVFDPTGLVAPFTVGARLLLKDIWRVSGQHWDKELPKDTVERFLEWSIELPKLAEITILRSYFSGNFEHLELHVFGDSSQEVFSAVAFLRAQVNTSSGPKTELAFVLGKARVAPMKVMTVPKLELQAALLAARSKRDNCRALCMLTKFLCGAIALLFCCGLTPQATTQCLLQTVYARFWHTIALTNRTTLPQAIIQQMPVLVACPPRFCNQVAG